jgi:uncharacterized protein
MSLLQKRNLLLAFYLVLAIGSGFMIPRLKFAFDFEQFFPQGDPDYAFYKEFIADFETDDNFMLIAVERKAGVFDSSFLADMHQFALKAGALPFVTSSTSLTQLQFPQKTPFGILPREVLHTDQPDMYASDSVRIMLDRRLKHNLISSDGTALTILLKIEQHSTVEQAGSLMAGLDSLIGNYAFEKVHYLGRPYFQRELIKMEKREIAVSSVIAAILVLLILYFLFRKWLTVGIFLVGIGLAMLFFLGTLSLLGRELNALAALYPILLCIVGVADSIHLSSKYLDELEKGHDKETAIRITLKEIGFATFITCVTTAIGFASLLTSRTYPIRDFGVNAALGVVVAFVVIFGWLWAVLPRFSRADLMKDTRESEFWPKFMHWNYQFTARNGRLIAFVSFALLGLSFLGISKIQTNYTIEQNLPRGEKITDDFLYFEHKFSGFRPLEFAVIPKEPHQVGDLKVLHQMELLEDHLITHYGSLRSLTSVNDIYRSINLMQSGNNADAYILPTTDSAFQEIRDIAARMPKKYSHVLVNEEKNKARISTRMVDVGRDSIMQVRLSIEKFIAEKIDTNVVSFRMTGTGLILDKNSDYIRNNMLQGLIPSVLIVALIMALIFKEARLVLIFTIPNVFPLFFAGALIGYLGIPLEAGVATVFSIVFGIATDDTVHFLSTFQLARKRGETVENAIKITIDETGKAMCMGSLILFFSFLVLLFSVHPPSVTVGLLVSVTLAAALFCDLLLVPVLLRRFYKD